MDQFIRCVFTWIHYSKNLCGFSIYIIIIEHLLKFEYCAKKVSQIIEIILICGIS